MKKVSSALLVAVLFAGCGGNGQSGAGDDGTLVLMTRNLYLGAPLEPLLQLVDPTQLPAAVGTTWRTVQASDVPGRMSRVANEIVAAGADVVALQEVALFQTRPLLQSAPPTTAYDFLQLLLDHLHGTGHEYVAAGTSTNIDVELPDDTGQRIRFVDRDVVLVRSGVQVSGVTTSHYATLAGVSAGSLSATIPRGYVSLQVEAEGLAFTLLDTHLEIEGFHSVQEAQARELAAVLPASGDLLVMGDLNSAADGSSTASYAIVVGAGLTDPWTLLHPGDPGLTCCFAPDLRDPAVALTERIDFVLYRGALSPAAVTAVGATPSSKTAAGVYPSDHAGVVATFHGGR